MILSSSAPEPVPVSVKQMQPLGDGWCAAVLRGTTRAALTPGAVALPVNYEPYCTRVGILHGMGQEKPGAGSSLRLAPASELYATVRDVYALPHGSQLVVLSRPFPLYPGTTLEFGAPGSSGRPVSGSRGGQALVLGCYPRVDSAQKGSIRDLVHEDARRPPRPMDAPELYRVTGVSAGSEEAPPARDAVRVGVWWVSPVLLGRCEQALVQRCRRTGGARGSELRETLRGMGIGPALGDALVHNARSRIIERRGSAWLPAGAGPGEFLSLPARRLLARIEAAGTDGLDAAAERALGRGGAGGQLVDHGLVIPLENGRLFSVAAYRELAARTAEGIATAEGDLHQRDLAAALGLSRNSTRALVARMARDGLIERASAVHVRARAGGEPR